MYVPEVRRAETDRERGEGVVRLYPETDEFVLMWRRRGVAEEERVRVPCCGVGDGRRRRWKNDESDESRRESGKDGEVGADIVVD